ncbi:protein YAE1 homolog [Sorex araneus]|uniref:protein YAE1 homolog n=1 Tax=Sorex araneus TaxID=42254 RepID=UPI0003318F61|nr:protein YAE1 homolog [Sorex araneus]
MSWVRAVPATFGAGVDGDVFDEDADESLLVQREWQSHMQRRVKEGYRDGVDAGRAQTLQRGFNQGYKEGAEAVISYGQLRGTLSALLTWCHLHDRTAPLMGKIRSLLDAVGQCEECVLRQLDAITPQPRVVDLSDSIQDMDLCHRLSAEGDTDEAKDGRLCESNADFNKNCSKNAECSSLGCFQTEDHILSEKPDLTWILEQTNSLVKQLGVPIDVLQHLKQL